MILMLPRNTDIRHHRSQTLHLLRHQTEERECNSGGDKGKT